MGQASGTDEIRLDYESPHFLQSLFAGDTALLKTLGERLSITITTRDGWLRLAGEREAIDQGRQIFEQLEKARREGSVITAHTFNFAIDSTVKTVDSSEQGDKTALSELVSVKLLGTPRKPAVSPRTVGQLRYIQSIDNHDVVFGVGPAGTGKTYLAMACAITALKERQVNRIILTRPAVEAGEALGFLPGDLNEKIFPYLRPLYDALYDMLEPDEVEKYIESNLIEIAPLAYMRGRTLSRAFIILDEAQNTTEAQMFMFLTRLGEDSRCVVTGDATQIDLRGNMRSGLVEAMKVLPGTKGIDFIRFDTRDVVRHPVVQRIINAYQKHRDEPGS
ncbi:MAG: phosphate starvation-inducible PhoH-like protein [Verrucomicrobiales bacterium]